MRVVMAVVVMLAVKQMVFASGGKTRRGAKNESEQGKRDSFHVQQRTTLPLRAASRYGIGLKNQPCAARLAQSEASVH